MQHQLACRHEIALFMPDLRRKGTNVRVPCVGRNRPGRPGCKRSIGSIPPPDSKTTLLSTKPESKTTHLSTNGQRNDPSQYSKMTLRSTTRQDKHPKPAPLTRIGAST
eukprot:26574-Rhodomonas_salina.1